MSTEHVFPQPSTFGANFIGLDATPTGSDAANDVVADFTAATQVLFDAPSVAIPVTATHSQTLGSTFKINVEGIWVISARVQATGIASVLAGLGLDNVAGDLSIDPALPTSGRNLDRALSISAAADTVALSLISGPIGITRNQALSSTGGLVRLLLSNNAGAGAAAAALVLASCFICFRRIGDLPSTMRD